MSDAPLICECCRQPVTPSSLEESAELFGECYSGWCYDCACDDWHDANIAPDDSEDDTCEPAP